MIAKNEEMKRVFGLGYPSRPVYTVEEFGEKQVELMRQQERVNLDIESFRQLMMTRKRLDKWRPIRHATRVLS
jgi:hypothetical protein